MREGLMGRGLVATGVIMAVLVLAQNTHVPTAQAQVSIGIGLPGISIGINVPAFPTFTVVPDYPVYYAPQANVNLFFYDGLYWVYQRDNWYASSWYDGPWDLYAPEFVPLFILRVPVRYYVSPPIYFRGWEPYGPPRWGEHWGRSWEQSRRGWDQWDRRTVVAPAPLPVYQRQYSGDRYPRVEQQAAIREQNYKYSPRDPVVQQQGRQQPVERRQPAGAERQGPGVEPQQQRGRQQGERQPPPAVQQRPQERQRSSPPSQQVAPAANPTLEPQKGREQTQQPQQGPAPQPQREQRAQQPQPRREAPQASRQQPPVERPASRLPSQQPVQPAPAPQPQRQRETQQGAPVVQHQQAAPQQPQERPQRDAPPHQPQQGQEQQGRGQEQGRGHEKGG